MKYGKHTDLVEAFLTHLESGNVDWDDACRAADAVEVTAWGAATDAAWEAAWDAADAAVAAWDAARDAADAAAWDAAGGAYGAAGYAVCEIIGHELLAERGNPLVFLPMFGLDIEKLKEMVK